MNDASSAAKDQIAEKLRNSSNILIAVSMNPSIDQLAAAIAMTLILNKYKKNATAVFSGKVPRAIDFLKPKESIERTTDSLRDFIISLDKAKADKLRYKVEDDVVKIFITPYKTSLTPKDFKYSAGDFNIDVILALGVLHQEDLDKAITAHGRIFHDAVVLSINNVAGSNFGTLNWEDTEASSMSELVSELIPSLDNTLIDTQIATALLTGIVAETSRFSNGKTHPRTMQVSSSLLAAGADQQLVNQQLQDVIGQVYMPAAGSEIKPTVEKPVEADSAATDAEELVVDENGVFNLATKDAASAAETSAVPAPTPAPEPSATEAETPAAPTPEPPAAPTPEATAVPAPPPAEDLDLTAIAGYETTPVSPPNSIGDTDAARRALDDAFAALHDEPAAPQSAPPAPDVPSAPPQAPPTPQFPQNSPGFGGGLPTLQTQEPAPLSMSPADQASTMPLPPPPPPITPLQPEPYVQPAPSPQSPSAPPVPPPIAPTGFGTGSQ